MSTNSSTMIGQIVTDKSTAIKIASVFMGSWSLALMAQAKFFLPFSPVPVTAQTLGVVLLGALLGSRLGVLATLAYLAQGALGLPFFAGTSGGLAVFSGATAGYLVGFPVAAWLVGTLAERGFDRGYARSFLMFFLALIPIFSLGALWLGSLIGYDKVWALGVMPFLPGALAKTLFATLLLPTLRRFF